MEANKEDDYMAPVAKQGKRKSSPEEQKELALLLTGEAVPSIPGYEKFADSDALDVLLEKNIASDHGAEGYAYGWKWEALVNGQFHKGEAG